MLISNNNKFYCLVESKPVKLETSHTVILPPAVSVLCYHPWVHVLHIKCVTRQFEISFSD